MPKSRWARQALIALALLVGGSAGLLTLKPLCPSGYVCQPDSEKQDSHRQGNSQDNRKNTTDSASGAVTSVKGIESAITDPKSPKDTGKAESKESREKRDLRAQERMAFWAIWMAIAAIATAVITFGGLVLIKGTLDSTKEAVLAQQNAERPHVRLFRTIKKLDKAGRVIGLHGVNFRNIGRTPALIQSMRIGYVLSMTPPLPENCPNLRKFPDDSAMILGEEWPRKGFVPPYDDREKLDELLDGVGIEGKRLFVYGEVTYLDAFDTPHVTGFCRVFDGGNFTYNKDDVNEDKRLNYTT